jgi:hypothetical protein
MSSVWDDAANEDEVNLEETTPIPEGSGGPGNPLKIAPEKIESLAIQVLEKVAREIIPEMAERILREKIDEILKEPE